MSLLPPNATDIERAVEAVGARAANLPVPLRSLWNAATCPAPLLPWLAWGVGIDNWSPDWPEAVKRARIAAAIPIARRKGTAASVRAVIASFGGLVALREWWQTTPRGAPYTFDLTLDIDQVAGVALTAAYAEAVIEEVRRTIPVRCAFTFTQATSAAGGIRLAAAARPVIFRRLELSA